MLKMIKKIKNKFNRMENKIDQTSAKLTALEKLIEDKFSDRRFSDCSVCQTKLHSIEKTTNEMLWAQIFNNAISGSEWLLDQSFSPGRWAVGYPFLYLLFRVLDGQKPDRIIELGMGQTTKMITQYANHFKAKHDVIEHDQEWIIHCQNTLDLSPQTIIHRFDLEQRELLEDLEVTTYKGFHECFADQSYSLISIDGPFGGNEDIYARIDLLDLIPGCLAQPFVILVDDYNRACEKRTVELIKQKLVENNIQFEVGIYSGVKDTLIIVSKDIRFYRSM